ncbi:MAG: DUF1697 domain-containing protein [Nocardioidaceae bacterium]
MTAYVSLLRGINLGPSTQISMPRLKEIYDGLGLASVATYIRSGNVVFSAEDSAEEVRERIESGIEGELGMDIEVVIRTAAELADTVARNPFPRADPARLHVVFLSVPVGAADLDVRLGSTDYGSDEYAVDGREIYLHLPNGFGRSKLATRMSALRIPHAVATVRNWRTVNKLVDLSGALSDAG